MVEAVRSVLAGHGITQNRPLVAEKDIKSAIRSNIASLFDSAELLASKEYYGPAIHLMMAAREECAKWILIYCWAHLDRNSRAKVFSHDFKHKTGGVFYFLSGQLQAMDFVVGGLELLKNKDPQISEATAALIGLLSKTLDSPESIAKSVVDSFHFRGQPDEPKEITAQREAAFKKLVDDAEALRQNSIYVDFDPTLSVSGQPANFDKDDYAKIRTDVILAKYHIDKLAGLDPSKDILHSTFPEWKDELEKSLQDLTNRLAKVK
jgi:AbiV family abortive infection protein